ncbi:MAG TPA: SgcJ/EcaC family oxidoreductase [Cyclobacteriaceae bacterium]|nr:SgcJ/EcaC family oxidoreductase [Cyclobacteriaceae bacterium]
MKKVVLILAVVCIGFVSCQKNQATAPAVNKEEASKAVGELFDGLNSAFKNKDANTMGNFLSDDGLFLGTDPSEFWSKQRVVEEVSNMAKDPTVDANFTVDKREVRISPDGMMALVIEQAVVPFLGKIPSRMIGHARMKDGQWKIDFYSWSLIPKNESLNKLSEAYQ